MSVYGLSTAMFHEWSVERTLAAIAEAGFSQVELMGDAGHLGDWPAAPRSMCRALEAAGLRVCTVHSPSVGWNNGDPDETARRASIAANVLSFSQAAEVGAEIVICHPNFSAKTYAQEAFDANMALSRDSLASLAERARQAGIKMAVENLPARGQPRPGSKVAHVLQLIDGLGEHVGVCLDAGHSNANGLSAAAEALEAGARLMALHVQDNDGKGEDQHWVPGQGTTDWEAFLSALARMRFAGVRTLEVGAHDRGVDLILADTARVRREWGQR